MVAPPSTTRSVDPDRLTEIRATRRRASAGDVDALFLLATWHLAGHPLPRDVPEALRLLRRAADIGHVDAALMRIALIASGAAAPPDWTTAKRLLDIAARTDPVAARQRTMVDAMALKSDGSPRAPYGAEQLSDTPRILRFPSLLSRHECAYLAEVALPFLRPSEIADPASGQLMRHPVRTSHDAVIGPAREDLVVGAINRRIAAISDTDYGTGEPLAVMRYGVGDQFRPHLDALPFGNNPRIKTVILYLNDNFEGGATHFVRGDLHIRPLAGSAVLFDNHRPDGRPDLSTLHAGLPVENGSKWIATRWIRQRPLDVWHR